MKNKCLRCGYSWKPKKLELKTCPKCKSPYWNTPRNRDLLKYFNKIIIG